MNRSSLDCFNNGIHWGYRILQGLRIAGNGGKLSTHGAFDFDIVEKPTGLYKNTASLRVE